MVYLPCSLTRIRYYLRWLEGRIMAISNFNWETCELVNTCYCLAECALPEDLEAVESSFWEILQKGIELTIKETPEMLPIQPEQMTQDLNSVKDWLRYVSPISRED